MFMQYNHLPSRYISSRSVYTHCLPHPRLRAKKRASMEWERTALVDMSPHFRLHHRPVLEIASLQTLCKLAHPSHAQVCPKTCTYPVPSRFRSTGSVSSMPGLFSRLTCPIWPHCPHPRRFGALSAHPINTQNQNTLAKKG